MNLKPDMRLDQASKAHLVKVYDAAIFATLVIGGWSKPISSIS
jgi:hypothetical protein